MQQILSATAETQTGFLPFTFDAIAEDGLEFANILQKNINNLETTEQTELLNNDFSTKLDLIQETIPADDVIELSNEKLDDKKDKSDEIATQAFAVLNLISNTVDNFNEISTSDELTLKMKEAGISEENIKKAFQILENSSTNKQQGINSEKTDLSTETEVENIKPNNQNIIEQFKNNDKDIKHLLSENILMGKEISQLQQKIEQQNSNTAQSTNENIIADNKNSSQENSNQATDSKISEMLSLFKNTNKDELNKVNTDLLNLQKTNKTINNNQANKTENTKAEQPEPELQTNILDKSKELSSKDVIANQQAIQENTKAKTHGEINKSEYKELASKFIDKMAEEQLKTTTEKAENTNITEDTSVFMPINSTTKNLHIKETTLVQNIENIEVADSTKTDTSTDEIKSNDAKPLASNFNMHLYKLAQQTNIQNQITLAIRNLRDSNTQQLKIKLNPKELGSISIEMEMVNNVAKGIITVEKPELAKHLAQNLNKMFTSFKEAGFNLNTDNIVVKIDEDSNQQDSQFTKKESNNNEDAKVINLNEEIIDIKI
jgi:flagellar hook-length control protein FliK